MCCLFDVEESGALLDELSLEADDFSAPVAPELAAVVALEFAPELLAELPR